jgi:hypothetical protein
MQNALLLLTLLVIGGSAHVSAQSAKDDAFFRGVVVDAVTGDSIRFVHMMAYRPDRSWTGATDFDGFFMIRLPKKWLFIEVKMAGYRTEQFVVDLTSGWVEMRIELQPEGKEEH